MAASLPREIFKAYDIRGIVGKTLTPEIVELIGHALGSEAVARGQHSIVLGRDGRLSGPEFAEALARGLRNSGMDVIDLGQVATPMAYFAAYQLGTHCAAMITGSHNPPEYNGIRCWRTRRCPARRYRRCACASSPATLVTVTAAIRATTSQRSTTPASSATSGWRAR